MYLLEFAGEDDRLAAAEAGVVTTGCEVAAPGIGTTEEIDIEMAARLALTRRIVSHLGTVEGSLSDLIEFAESVTLDSEGSVAVRARDVRGLAGVDTQLVERELGTVLVDRGFAIDLERPTRELRVFATVVDDTRRWYLGWHLLETPRGYGDRAPPKRPFRQPGTMDAMLARVLVNLSRVQPEERLFDPMCGPGGVLIEAALIGVEPLGMDVQRRMVEGASENIDAVASPSSPVDVIQGTASQLPVRSVDAVVFDAPYGRQSPIAHDSARELVAATLSELQGVTARCVAVFDAPVEELAVESGWSIIDHFERRVHRSLTRHITVLEASDG